MRYFYILLSWAFITLISSLQFQDEPWSFDDTSFLPESWSFDDPSSFPELDFTENEPTSSLFMPSDDGDLALDTTFLADNNLSGGGEFIGFDENPLGDDGMSFDEFASGDISLDLEADCGDVFQYSGRRRAKRGAVCKDSPATGTGKRPDMPDKPGLPPPLPEGPSFFPGYGRYILDKKTNILRIPDFSPRYHGENDVCLIYTEGYLPYGVCGSEQFKSADEFWGINTYTVTKAVLGMSPFILESPKDGPHYLLFSSIKYFTK